MLIVMFSFCAISIFESPFMVIITILCACFGRVPIALYIKESTSSSRMYSCSDSSDMNACMSLSFFCFTRSCFK